MADVEAAIAVATGLPAHDVAYFSRRLRERGLVIRETKSPQSWRASPTDAAHIVAALLSGATGGLAAPAAVAEMLKSTLAVPHAGAIREKLSFLPELRGGLLEADNFIAAIAAVLTHVNASLTGTGGGYLVRAFIDYHPIENIGGVGLIWKTALAPAEEIATFEFRGPEYRTAGLTVRRRLHHAAIVAIAGLWA